MSNHHRKVVCLCSGGMDSVVALYHMVSRGFEVVHVLSFDYKSKHNAKEIPFARHHAHKLNIPHTTIPLDFMHEVFSSHLLQSGAEIPDGHYADEVMKQTVVPFRNGIMLSIAAGFAESKGAEMLCIAAHAGDHAIYPDCRADFMETMGAAIKLGTYAGIQLFVPFQHYTKADIVARGTELGVDFTNTWSCYKGKEEHCGSCGTCIERREAFYLAQVNDPTKYSETAPSLVELAAHNFRLPK